MNGKSRILIVDDDVPMGAMIATLLMRNGYDVQSVSNGNKALDLLQKESFDLITLDVDMPDGNGFDLFKRLKPLPAMTGARVVFISGRNVPEYRERALELGAVDFIGKPFDVQTLLTRIADCFNNETPK